MEKIKTLEKALNNIGIRTSLEEMKGLSKGKVYRVLVLELKNVLDSFEEPYSFIFHPTTYQLLTDITQGEKVKN